MTTHQNTTPPQAKLSRSRLFSVYNTFRIAARAGKLDVGRVNRALGILQSKAGAARLAHYEASTRGCWREDARRGHKCKHQIARMIEQRAGELAQVTQ